MFYRKNGTKGFTLIELLVVIAIIGILATIVLSSLNTARERARDAKRVGDLRNLQPALELFADDNNGNYPAVATWETDLVSGGYINALPFDPGTDAFYTYESTGGSRYLLQATLENTNHTALDTDVDDATRPTGFTTGCEDPSYCIAN